MFIFLKELGVLLIWLATAAFAGFGLLPESAIAPDLTPPARIVANVAPDQPDTTPDQPETPAQTTDEGSAPGTVASSTSEASTDPFKNLADAFSKLSEDQTGAPAASTESVQDVNTSVRNALVNIICLTGSGETFGSISASGVIIDPRGVILTNAHVAEYLLLANYPRPGFVQCTIRTGSPATPAYTAELLYMPPSWIADNAQKIDDETPTGTGEHDYALLYITGTVSKSITMPSTFPYLDVLIATPDVGDTVLVAGYPAGFLGGITVQKDLYAASAQATIGQLYTFGSQSIDLYSVGGTVVAQHGSSGGAVAGGDGALVGLIVTSTDAPDTASRDLRALTTPYIVNDFQKENGITLATYLAGDLESRARTFNRTVAPTLTEALVSVLEN